ncbi:hypothetical protein TcWFU_002568 [Taenia crassiceps]|uniref:Protein kinase domain-containing protein n=1 Tax=Taenia crassiceps TaxID=6207 RepID=A0ABR4QAL2_9CEST
MLCSRNSLGRLKEEELRAYAERVKLVPNVPESDIQIEKWGISGGGYGVVSFGTYRRKSVVKKDFRFMNTIVERIHNYREVCTLAACNHPNIVKFIGAGPNTRMADVHYVVIERAMDASLDELIYSGVGYSFWHVMLWALHLADGFWGGQGGTAVSQSGLASIHGAGGGATSQEEFYTCYSKAVDIYSMAVSIWELVTRRLDLDVNPHSTRIHSCPPFLQSLFDRGMAVEPSSRPSASQLVKLFDFIMRNVCTKDTSQLCIHLEETNTLSTPSANSSCTNNRGGL